MSDTPLQIELGRPRGAMLDGKVEFRKGTYSNAAQPKSLEYLGLPNARKWQPSDLDWQLPPDWQRIILDGMKERLQKYRSFRLFMDVCVRCGACADKCHFYLGSGDPKNMPVARSELVRSVYRRYFTLTGRLFGALAGGRGEGGGLGALHARRIRLAKRVGRAPARRSRRSAAAPNDRTSAKRSSVRRPRFDR